MSWQKAAMITELDSGPVIFRCTPKQLALFKVKGRVYAIDNRCPHEGYPLAQGSVSDGCLLTCHWHNWKFQLQDGKCVVGGDHVRSYAVEQRGEEVWVNLADPPPEEMQQQILEGLERASEERDFGRICREITRLHYNGLDELDAVRHAVHRTHAKLEFGTTHAFAAAADWVTLAEAYRDEWEKRLICLAEAVDHMAFDALRQPEYAYAPAGNPFEAGAFAAAVEAERLEEAEGMVRRGLNDGMHWNDMEEAFARAALAHYNDFGHSLIYVLKTSELLAQIGSDAEADLVLPLARHLCYTTREDLLPEFSDYAASLAEVSGKPAGAPSAGTTEGVFPASVREACRWVVANIGGNRPEALYDRLLEASARNLLHFDTAYEQAYDLPVNQSVGWLFFTHAITFANAARKICTHYPSLWPQALLQMACFVGRNRRFLDLEMDETTWMVDDSEHFFEGIAARTLDHGMRDPIFSAHLVKTSIAVEAELSHATQETRTYLLAGLNRCLNFSWKQKHTRRLARQAIELVGRDFG